MFAKCTPCLVLLNFAIVVSICLNFADIINLRQKICFVNRSLSAKLNAQLLTAYLSKGRMCFLAVR